MAKQKWMIGVCALTALACGIAAACTTTDPGDNPGGDNPGGDNPGGNNPGGNVTATYTLELTGTKTRTLIIDADDEAPVTDTLAWTVKKDGEIVTSETVTVTVSGTAVSYDEETQTVTAVEVGDATVTLSLTEHTDVASITVRYSVVDYFFSRDIQRGSIDFSNEANGTVTVMGGQAVLVAEKKASAWVLRGVITPVDYNTTEAFGIGSFLDNGDHALWFGLKNKDGQADGKFNVHRQDFYGGWPGSEVDVIEGYTNRYFEGGIYFEMIRDGNNYYYTIDSYYGTYTASEQVDTFPGFYSQERYLEITDFEAIYDADEIAAAVAAYATKGAASVAIQETNYNRLVKGADYQFSAKIYPAGNDAAIEWTLDKTAMTAGADSTSVSENGLLHLSDDAAGNVTLIATSGSVSDRHVITILAETENKENDLLAVSGGVILEDDGSIVFPEYMMSTNGVGNETAYDESSSYAAILKETVRGDFSLEFTVSDYKSQGDYPKLMFSLGGSNNQFYVVYNRLGTINHIETYTKSIETGNSLRGGQWVNSDDFTAFDTSIPHTFKISVVGGLYTVTVDGAPLSFNMDGTARVPVRTYEDYISDLPIRISTNGVSAKISDIKLTKSDAPMPEYFGYGGFEVVENGITMKFLSASGWDKADYKVVRTARLPENYTATMTVTLSDAMTDSKVFIWLGSNYEVQIINKAAAGSGIRALFKNHNDNTWNDTDVEYESYPDGSYTVAVRLEYNNGTMRALVGGKVIGSASFTSDYLAFSVFNEIAADAEATVSFTDITVGAYAEEIIYAVDADSALTVTQGLSREISYQVLANGNVLGADKYTADITLEGTGHISYENGTVTALAVGTEKLTISITVDGEVVATHVIEVSVTEREVVETNENDLLTVKGGVVLYTDGTLEFPESMRGTNGVGNETAYEDNSYSANLKENLIGNFSIEFTVTNYKTSVEYPKLMISLGGNDNQFYVVYNRQGSVNRIETYTKTLNGNGDACGGQWVSSSEFANFNTAEAHTFKIAVLDGVYEIYLDGAKLDNFYMDNDYRPTLFRPYDAYATAQPVRISTNGVSCEVSNIKVINGTAEDAKKSAFFATVNKYISDVTDDGFTMSFAAQSWAANDNYGNIIFRTTPLPEEFTVEYTLTFSGNMTDSKFVTRLGDIAIMINNKGNSGEISCNVNGVGNDWQAANVPGAPLTMTVKIVKTVSHVYVYFNGSDTALRDYDAGHRPTFLSFWAFNENGAEAGVTATISGLTVTAN